ncbi:MAG: hypothetical protein WCH01_04095 [Methylococcaceae bacterium]
MTAQLKEASSSNVQAYWAGKIGDEQNSNASLIVQFKSGGIYRYQATEAECMGIENAPSKGQYVNILKKTAFCEQITPLQLQELLTKVVIASEPKTKKRTASKEALQKRMEKKFPEFAMFFV